LIAKRGKNVACNGTEEVSRARALRIIAALRQGSNCLEGAEAFSAGREILLRAADEELEELEITNAASVRWLKGRYGHGKTHMFARLMDLGHRRNWVTSYFQIRLSGQGLELSRFNEVYSAIVRNCLCRGMLETEDDQIEPGKRSGWDWILEQWWGALRQQAGAALGDIPTFRMQDTINHAVTSLQHKWAITGSFCEALRQFAIGRFDSDQEWVLTILAWFAGEDVHARGSEVRTRLRAAGIRESVNRRNAKEMLRCLSAFLRYRGFGGVMILMDEVENALHATPKARRESYTILRELIDNVDDRHGMSSACFYAAGTPDLFEGEKGFTEYEALAERVLLPGGAGAANPRASLIDLSEFPLDRTDFETMGRRIIDVYARAKNRKMPSTVYDSIPVRLNELFDRNPDASARAWVRSVVDALDTGASEEQ